MTQSLKQKNPLRLRNSSKNQESSRTAPTTMVSRRSDLDVNNKSTRTKNDSSHHIGSNDDDTYYDNGKMKKAIQNSTTVTKFSVWSYLLKTGLLMVLFVLGFPLVLSEIVGGWTRKYTSWIQFTPSTDIGDLTGQVALVTGANTGIGYHTALELARHGAHVIVATRSIPRGQAALDKMQAELNNHDATKNYMDFKLAVEPKLTLLQLDLSSLDSVAQFAKEFLALHVPLHILILNAGVMKSPGAELMGQTMNYGFDITQDGFESHIGINHIGHFKLTQLLQDKLQSSAPSRVVVVSSMAERGAYKPEGIVFDQWVPSGGVMPERYEDGNAYGQSKLANLLFAAELAERWNHTGVTAYALHPGMITSELSRHLDTEIEKQLSSNVAISRWFGELADRLFDSCEMDSAEGALTQLHLATAPQEALESGAYYFPIGKVLTPTHAQGTNKTLQKILWEETMKAIQLRSQYTYSGT
jgi:retinol dehydrogenase-12